MPTSDEYAQLATYLRGIVAQLEDFVLPLENGMGAHVLEGGELTESVYESIKHTRVTSLSLSGIVAEYAAEAQRRQEEAIAAAAAKATYDDELAAHKAQTELWDRYQAGELDGSDGGAKVVDVEEPGPPPTPPPDPPAYVDI